MRDTTLWRYQDFTKFVSLISTKSLFFCRADKFDDPFEGATPEKAYRKTLADLEADYDNPTEFEIIRKLREVTGTHFRQFVYISCWHISAHESAALWKLYLSSHEGIAIRSTRHRLSSCFTDSKSAVWTVPVRYIDYERSDPPVPTRMAPFRYKRKSFAHEKELRAIIYGDPHDADGRLREPKAESGIYIPVDLARLIEAIYIAPTAPSWFVELVSDVCDRYGLSVPIRASTIATQKPKFL